MENKKTKNWWSIGAWTLATAVLIGSLVYFNLPRDTQTLGVLNGDCPDFTVDCVYSGKDGKMVIDEEKTFALSDHQGDIVVLNFWATYCEPCKKEIPDFNRIYEEYKDEGVEVVILNGEFDLTAQSLLDKKLNYDNPSKNDDSYDLYYHAWPTYTCTFARFEKNNDILGKFDVSTALPVTVIVGRDGKIKYMAADSLHYDELKELLIEVDPALAK